VKRVVVKLRYVSCESQICSIWQIQGGCMFSYCKSVEKFKRAIQYDLFMNDLLDQILKYQYLGLTQARPVEKEYLSTAGTFYEMYIQETCT